MIFRDLRAQVLLGRSLRRIAGALEEQNRIRKFELEQAGLILPEPNRKFTQKEAETEVSYASIEPGVEGEDAEEGNWREDLKNVFGGNR